MSDLSELSLVPRDEELAAAASGPAYPQAFAWPTPPYADYAAATPQSDAQACVIEGMNGKSQQALMTLFDIQAGVVHVQVPPARSIMPLRMTHFRRLTLTEPLLPRPAASGTKGVALEGFRLAVDFQIRLTGGGEFAGRTVGHVENPLGLFLFEKLDDAGAVRRIFLPRGAYEQARVGELVGELLVRHNTASPAQIAQAIAEQKELRAQKVGDILINQKVVSSTQLSEALDAQSRMRMIRIGEALIGLGLINQEQLDAALAQQQVQRTVPLGELLVRAGHIQRSDLRLALARKMGYPVVDVEAFPVDAQALRLVTISAAKRLGVLPLQVLPGRLVAAIEDPSRRDAIDELEFIAQCKVVPVLPATDDLMRTIVSTYARYGFEDTPGPILGEASMVGSGFEGGVTDSLLASLDDVGSTGQQEQVDEKPIEQADNTLVRLINTMIVDAHTQGVSDIHIEAVQGKEKVRIRFRRDGMLKPYVELPHTYRNALIARIKIMCDLDISERRRPQDGKINFARFVPGCPIELRVATIPTANGLEDAVMRILASAKPIPLDKLGMSERNLRELKAAVERPYGMVLCVGPTGSGKTTTLHSALSYINTPERKIWTAEDPVEITQAGLRQVQVNPKIDWTFAKALRAFLRADPDVIMVGEIRDGETAGIAVESSLTGHLVLSTLHTNSAAETITRLLDMGMDPFNFADSLLAVLAQRLVRRQCPKCLTSKPATGEQVEEWLDDYLHAWGGHAEAPSRDSILADWLQRFGKDGQLQAFHSPGCDHCDHTGVRGRAGIHELLTVSRNLRRLVQTGSRAEELHRQAMIEGMHTLRQDGLEKMLQGITSIEEVRATSNV